MQKLFTTTSIVAVLALSLGVAGSALAQDTGGEVATPAPVRDEIIVQARKTGENIDDVPSSISVLSGQDAELLALDGIADYIRQIPSAILVNGGPEYLADISIRGQGGGRQGFSESATGIYRNGIYIAGGGFGGRSFSRLDFFDVQNIETYRGPQGALYGRNAVGGAVNVVSKRPTDDATGALKFGYESGDRRSGSAIVNVPINDAVAARLGAFYIDQKEGFIGDVATGEGVNEQKYLGLRGQVRADISSNTTVNVTVEYFDSTAPAFGVLGHRTVGRTAAGQTGDAEQTPFISADSRKGVVDIDSTAVFAELNSDLGVGDLTAVFSYKSRDGNRYNEDLDMFLGFQGVDLGGIETDIIAAQSEDFERAGGEIRLASKPGSEVSWLIGADYGTHTSAAIQQNSGTSGLGGLASLASRRDDFVEDLTSISGFGLVEFGVAEKTTLTLEARVQNDSKDFIFTRTQVGRPSLATGNIGESWTRFLPAATLSYDLNDDQLIFLRGASGYRPGGFNTGLDAANANFVPYDPETAYSAELGWKGTVFDNVRFSLNGFYTKTGDVQGVSGLSEIDPTIALQNVGDSSIYGIEAEVSGVLDLGPGRMRWNASAASTNGSFSDGSTITTNGGGLGVEVVDLSGARVNRTRDYIVAANARYTAPLTQSTRWFVGGSFQAEGGGYANASGDTTSITGRPLDHFAIFDARVGVKGDNWQLSVFGKNLGNELYVLQQVTLNDFYNDPRKWGVELKVNIGG